jgi:drug/metabolite transporter (DMT)-like permease
MKTVLMRTVNWLLYAGFCALIGTGFLLTFRLPPGSRGGRGMELLGWGRHDWGDVHFWAACVVVVLTIAHLALNWAWVRRVASHGRRWQLLAGAVAGFALIALFLLLPVTRQHSVGIGDPDHSPPPTYLRH